MTLKLFHYVRSKIIGKVAKFHCDIYSSSKVMQNKREEGARVLGLNIITITATFPSYFEAW